MATYPKVKITNKRAVILVEYDCDGPYKTLVNYGEVACPYCGYVRTLKTDNYASGDGMTCAKCYQNFDLK